MSGEISRSDIQEMANLLENRKKHGQRTVLLLGSRAGGLFRSYDFYDKLQKFSKRGFTNMSQLEQFGECYNLLQQGRFSERDLFSLLSSSLHAVAPSEADLYLAQLVKDQFFDIVISTNIDDMVERALVEVGLQELQHFQVLIPRRDVDLNVIYSQKNVSCWLIKVFGDLSSRSTNILTRKGHLGHMDFSQLKGFLERNLAEDILALGLDPTWDAGIFAAFPNMGGHYWLVNEQEFAENTLVGNTWQSRTVKFIAGVEGSYDSFLRALYWYLGKGKIPGNDQFIRGIHSKLQTIQDDLAQLKEMYSEVVKVQRKILKSIEEK